MTRSGSRESAWTLLSLLVAITLVLAPVVAVAAVKTWDQERVTALAGELHQQTRDLRAAVRRLPPPTMGQPGRLPPPSR
jgi:hypothetical protein